MKNIASLRGENWKIEKQLCQMDSWKLAKIDLLGKYYSHLKKLSVKLDKFQVSFAKLCGSYI